MPNVAARRTRPRSSRKAAPPKLALVPAPVRADEKPVRGVQLKTVSTFTLVFALLCVAAFAAGGSAALDAIERAGYDVLPGPPQASNGRRLAVLAVTLRRPEARRR